MRAGINSFKQGGGTIIAGNQVSFSTPHNFQTEGDFIFRIGSNTPRTFKFYVDGVDWTDSVEDQGDRIVMPNNQFTESAFDGGDNRVVIVGRDLKNTTYLNLSRGSILTGDLDLSGIEGSMLDEMRVGENSHVGPAFRFNTPYTFPEITTTSLKVFLRIWKHVFTGRGKLDMGSIKVTGKVAIDISGIYSDEIITPETVGVSLGNGSFKIKGLPNCSFVDISKTDNIYGSDYSAIDMRDNPYLSELDFGENSTTSGVAKVLLSGCSLGQYYNLLTRSRFKSKTNVILDISDNAMSTSLVNEYLSKIRDYLTANPFTANSVSILIHGTNSAPNNVSGGYDGNQAALDLGSLGVTVTTTQVK